MLRLLISDVNTLVSILWEKKPPDVNKGKNEMNDFTPMETRGKDEGESTTLL
jgi:hypothetical protein